MVSHGPAPYEDAAEAAAEEGEAEEEKEALIPLPLAPAPVSSEPFPLQCTLTHFMFSCTDAISVSRRT